MAFGRDPRRRDDPFARFFEEFEKDFQKMQAMMNDVMEQALKAERQGKPFVYGFQVRVGPDGRPQISSFGDTNVLQPGTEPAREPLSDVVEGEHEVAVTVELPGVEKKDIRLHVADERITIEVDAPRRYRKVLDLPARVKPSTAKATYKNGILDVTVQRESPAASPGHRVDIE